MALKFLRAACNLGEIALWASGVHPRLNNAGNRGRYGEWLGRKLLRSKGFRVIEKNWRSKLDRRQEIDVVCRIKEIVVFVEIRARSENALVSGFSSLTRRKKKSLRRSFKLYLIEADQKPEYYRFDVIEVDLPSMKGKKPLLFHHENVALFG